MPGVQHRVQRTGTASSRAPKKWMGVYEWETGTFPNIRLHALAFPCAHCEDPACAKACKNGALYKEDEFGAVLVDQDKCDGCRKMLRRVPLRRAALRLRRAGHEDEQVHDVRRPPGRRHAARVHVGCPLRALDFGPLDELVENTATCAAARACPRPTRRVPRSSSGTRARSAALVPYDAAEAIALNQQRGDLGMLFESAEDLVSFDEGTIRRDELRMKLTATVVGVHACDQER